MIARLRQAKQIDYEGVRREKRRVLEMLAERWTPDGDFARDYAEWRARIEGKDSVRYHMYVQLRIAEQLREVASAARKTGHGLYLDFPLGVNGGGYDVARYADSFVQGVSAGAPPDSFFTRGQNWGFPPMHPRRIRENGFDYFRAAIRHHVEHAGVLRLDHVMGLHRLYWIPDGLEAKDGVYVEYPAEELYAIVVLESYLHECAIVGEDLGTVPEEVPRAMAELDHQLPDVTLIAFPVISEKVKAEPWWANLDTARLLFGEYLKYVFAQARMRLDVDGAI
jgi:4-alpha-glucanotransferase